MEGSQPSSSSGTQLDVEVEDKPINMPTGGLIKDFEHTWYTQVKIEVEDNQNTELARNIELVQTSVFTLTAGLKIRLVDYDVQLWPQRLVENLAHSGLLVKTYYWLIGLPSIPSTQVAVVKNYLREWQEETLSEFGALRQTFKTSVQTKLIPRKALLEQNLVPDTRDLKEEQPVSSIFAATQTMPGETFKKKKGSNPQQVRQQFLHHVMGQSGKSDGPKPARLRPLKDILKRLRYDPAFGVDDYVVGYIDRKAGIREEPVSSWGEFQSDDLVAYVRRVSVDSIVWDRAAKIDLISQQIGTEQKISQDPSS